MNVFCLTKIKRKINTKENMTKYDHSLSHIHHLCLACASPETSVPRVPRGEAHNYIGFKKWYPTWYLTFYMVPHIPHFEGPCKTVLRNGATHVPHMLYVPHFVAPRRVYELQGHEERVIEAF